MISLRRSDIHMHDTCGYYIVWVDIGGATRALRALAAVMKKAIGSKNVTATINFFFLRGLSTSEARTWQLRSAAAQNCLQN